MAFSPLVWIALGVACLGLEIVMPGFVIFWFGIGALLTSAGIFVGLIGADHATAQWFFFFISSLVCLLAWHYYFKKYFKTGGDSDERDPTLNELRGKVLKTIMPDVPGEVELFTPYHGIKRWQAEANEIIEEGCEIAVLEARGIRLLVQKKNTSASV
jgi:membrane protein implicated in regulation of membrane protease activity